MSNMECYFSTYVNIYLVKYPANFYWSRIVTLFLPFFMPQDFVICCAILYD